MRQRPSLFNLGSPTVVANPHLLCAPITPHPVAVLRKQPLVGRGPDLPVLGTTRLIEYGVQVTAAEIDFHPGNVITLPGELGSLAAQRLAGHGRICAGLGCPGSEAGQSPGGSDNEPKTFLPFERLECFCIDGFVTAGVDFTGVAGDQHVSSTLDGFELVDLAPSGMEEAIECYAKLVVRLGLLPKLSVPLIRFVQAFAGLVTLTVEPTLPPAIPNNPALEDDQIKVFLNATVGPAPPRARPPVTGTAPAPVPGAPRPRLRTGAPDAVAAVGEPIVRTLFGTIRDGFSFAQSGSGSFGPFRLSYSVAAHLANGTIDLRSDNSIALRELDLVFDQLQACLGIDIPEICVGGFCIIPNPFGGCLVRAPRLCAFSANPDINFCLDLAALIRSEISATVRPLMRYSIDPGRLPAMNDWDARDAGVPDHWQVFIDPLTVDLDLFDFADAIGDLLEDALDAALNTILGPLPGWAKDLIRAILGPIINVVRDILDFGDDFGEWLSDRLGVSLGLFNTIITLVADYFSSRQPLLELENPLQALPADGPLMPVLIPIEFVGVQVDADEMVINVDLGG
jgi:hypothetical protein